VRNIVQKIAQRREGASKKTFETEHKTTYSCERKNPIRQSTNRRKKNPEESSKGKAVLSKKILEQEPSIKKDRENRPRLDEKNESHRRRLSTMRKRIHCMHRGTAKESVRKMGSGEYGPVERWGLTTEQGSDCRTEYKRHLSEVVI